MLYLDMLMLHLLKPCSDAFARLYDRRMLPPLSSCRATAKPPPYVNYFCPVHLAEPVTYLFLFPYFLIAYPLYSVMESLIMQLF